MPTAHARTRSSRHAAAGRGRAPGHLPPDDRRAVLARRGTDFAARARAEALMARTTARARAGLPVSPADRDECARLAAQVYDPRFGPALMAEQRHRAAAPPAWAVAALADLLALAPAMLPTAYSHAPAATGPPPILHREQHNRARTRSILTAAPPSPATPAGQRPPSCTTAA